MKSQHEIKSMKSLLSYCRFLLNIILHSVSAFKEVYHTHTILNYLKNIINSFEIACITYFLNLFEQISCFDKLKNVVYLFIYLFHLFIILPWVIHFKCELKSFQDLPSSPAHSSVVLIVVIEEKQRYLLPC